MAVYLGSDKVGVTKELGTDKLQWICDNVKNLQYAFQGYQGTSLDEVLIGLDTSKVGSFYYTFADCIYIVSIPYLDLSSVTSLSYTFYNCKLLETMPELDMQNMTRGCDSTFRSCRKIETINIKNLNSMTSLNYMFGECFKLKNLNLTNFDTSNVTSFSYTFYNCPELETIPPMNVIKGTSFTAMIGLCSKLKNLTLYNIKKTLQIGAGTSYGHLLTLDSLINTIKELWDLTGSTSQTLTMSTPSKNLIADVYIKLVEPTAEQIEADPNIIYKKNCVVCESTDEGAMTLTEYATSKNWAIA